MKTHICIRLFFALVLCTSGVSAQQRHVRVVHDSTAVLPGKEKRDNPAARIEWEVQRSRDPRTGTVPNNIKAREYAFASQVPARYPSGKEKGVQALQWTPVGPANVGGRTRALAFDINGSGVMLAGAVSGGMWRSTDDGTSWTKVTLPNEQQSVSCVVQDHRPGTTQVWYYGTGELLSTTDRRVDTLRRTLATGNGIYKSTDNGATWHLLPSTDGGAPGILHEHFQGVWELAVDNSNTADNEVYAACYGGVLRSANGGDSWSLALGDTEKKAFNTEVAVTSQGIVYAAIGSLRDTTKSPKQGIWRSADGVYWTDITPPAFPIHVRRTIVAVAPSDENVMYIFTETPILPLFGEPDFTASRHTLWKYTYKSGDGSGSGGEWTNLTHRIPGGPTTEVANSLNTLGGYCMVLAVHPEDANVVYLGGTDLYRTTDGFATSFNTRRIGGYPVSWQPNELHPDLHAIAFVPGTPSAMCVGGDGGMTWSYNNLAPTVEWQVANNGYISSQFYSIAMDPAQAGDPFVIGGLQDNGTFGTYDTDPTAPWTMWSGGDGTGCAVANNLAAIYASSQSGNILEFRYDEGVGGFMYTGLRPPPVLSFRDFNFITLFALEPTETNSMYLAAKHRLWRHNDLANATDASQWDPNWQEMTEIGTNGASIMAFGPSVQPAHRLYVGTNDGRVLRIDDAHTDAYTSTDITGDLFPEGAVVSSISVDPDNADAVLVSFSNYNVRSLFYSTNGGGSWTEIGGNLEEHPDGSGAGPSVRCVKIHRTGNTVYYFAGTSTGLFSTTEPAGAQTVWEQEGPTVVGNVMVEAIDSRSSDGRVIIGTQGNGVFAANLPAVSVGEPKGATALLLEQNYPNPAGTTTRVHFRLPASGPVELTLYNTLGERIFVAIDRILPAGEHAVDISTADLAPGAYFYRLQAADKVQTRMMTVVR